MPTRTLPRNSDTGAEAAWLILGKALKSLRNQPMAWLTSVWVAGWIVFAWHMIHPHSWQAVLDTVHRTVASQSGSRKPAAFSWLNAAGHWGEYALYVSSAAFAAYAAYAGWVGHRYRSRQLPEIREERFRGGCVLEITVPTGSKADSRAACDMLAEMWELLCSTGHTRLPSAAPGSRTFGTGNMAAERMAVSLEIWSSAQNDGKVGFYIWCPVTATANTAANGKSASGPETSGQSSEGGYMLSEEIRHLIMAHYPGCRVRWVADPVEKCLTGAAPTDLRPEAPSPTNRGVTLHWCELGLLADSRYPIGSGIAGPQSPQSPRTGTRALARPGSPGAGSDPLASLLGMLGSDESVPLVGVQFVAAARRETAAQVQRSAIRELELLREIEVREGGKALGPQHEARVLALEEKADRQGYDVMVRLVAIEAAGGTGYGAPKGRAEMRLTSLLRAFARYDRIAGKITQGFRAVRRGSAAFPLRSVPALSGTTVQPADAHNRARDTARVIARWPREGVCLPELPPFLRAGKSCVLNTVELAALYHFPHSGLESVRTLRWTGYKQLPTPAFARVSHEQAARGERVVLGLLDDDLPPEPQERTTAFPDPLDPTSDSGLAPAAHAARTAGVLPPGQLGVGTHPQDMRRGTYVFGPMGSGKSVFLYNAIVQYMAAGRGVGLIDGKGDSYEEVLKLVPQHLEGEVLTFDPESRRRGTADPAGLAGSAGPAGRTIGINPLDGRLVKQFGAEKVEALTMSLIRKMMGSNWDQAVLMQRLMRYGITAVLQVEPRPTMLNLWRWLQDDGKGGNAYRESALNRISNKLVQDFWRSQIGGMSSQQRSSLQNVLTRVDRYINNEVRHVILQPYSTVNFRQIMDRGTIFVGCVSPRLGEDQAFLGALLMNGFLTGAFARQSIPQEERRDYLLVVDEFQNFVDTGKADVERMLSMARGYRLGLMLAHQFTEQLPKEMLSAILKNVQTWVLFGLQADDARLFAGYMGLDASDFQNLPAYHSYQQTIVGNRKTGVYSARPLPVPVADTSAGTPLARSAYAAYADLAYDTLRSSHIPDSVARLAKGRVEEGERARKQRILELARSLYAAAEEGDDQAVEVLSLLTPDDFELYRRARSRVIDREERARLLSRPGLIADKARRIERLSDLRWGTPCVEVEALIRSTLRQSREQHSDADGDDGPTQGFYGA